jgi:poly(3-hydroxybutyrate) depolymerase
MKKWLLRIIIAVVGLLGTLTVVAVWVYAWLSSRTNGEITSSGERRTYLLYVPESYNPSTPASLVVSLHGAFLWPRSQMRFSGWNELADE